MNFGAKNRERLLGLRKSLEEEKVSVDAITAMLKANFENLLLGDRNNPLTAGILRDNFPISTKNYYVICATQIKESGYYDPTTGFK